MNKYIKLLIRALEDITGFIVIFLIIQVYFCCCYYVLGATFDDGGNYKESYDTWHNDFPYLDQGFVYWLQVLRTSIGDLQPPSYDYWGERYSANPDKG